MKNLSVFEKEVIEILRQLERCCDVIEQYNKDIEEPFEIMISDIDPRMLKRSTDLYDIAKCLQNKGLKFFITFDLENDIPDMYFDREHPDERFVQLGIINGESIQAVKMKIKELIGSLNPETPAQKLEIVAMPELRVKNVEEVTIAKGKKQIHLPKFKPTDWSKISIRFLDRFNVLITTDKKDVVPSDYESLGFADEKRGKPNMAWALLYGLSKNNGETGKLGVPIPEKIKQQKKHLSDCLKLIFKNGSDPFEDPTETNTYKIKIELVPPIEDKEPDKYGTEEYLREKMTEEEEKEYKDD